MQYVLITAPTCHLSHFKGDQIRSLNNGTHQILQLDEDDFSVGAQYFFIVTSAFTTRVRQQEKHQDTTDYSSCQTLWERERERGVC